MFYNLSIDIRKTLLLDRENRQLAGQTYLEKRYNDYVKLQEQSNLISNNFNDGLNNLPKKISMMKKLMPPKKKNSNSSSSSTASPMTEDEEQLDREL